MSGSIKIPNLNTPVEVVIQSRSEGSPPSIVRSRMNLLDGGAVVKSVKADGIETGKRHGMGMGTELARAGIHLVAEGGIGRSLAGNTGYDVWIEFYQGKTLIHETEHKKGQFEDGTDLVYFDYDCDFQ